MSAYGFHITHYELGITTIIPNLEMIKLRHRGVKGLAQVYTILDVKHEMFWGLRKMVLIPTSGIGELLVGGHLL